MSPKKMLGFGLAIFVLLVVLSLIYSQYVVQRQVGRTGKQPMVANDAQSQRGVPVTPPIAEDVTPLPAVVTPDSAADDLIDEALADREDLSVFAEDELADIEDGN